MHLQRSRSAGTVIVLAFALEMAVAVVWSAYNQNIRYQRDVGRAVAQNDLLAIHPIAEKWRADNPGECPTVERLRAEKELSATSILHDRWNGPYRIVCNEDDTVLRSDGPDRRPGTADDIVVSAAPPEPIPITLE